MGKAISSMSTKLLGGLIVLFFATSMAAALIQPALPRELFMWGGEVGEMHSVQWRNLTGDIREIQLTVLSQNEPTVLLVENIFESAECDCRFFFWSGAGTSQATHQALRFT